MKLSKSKLALAKVINENGGWPKDCKWSVQHGRGLIGFSINKPVRNGSESWKADGGFNFKIEVCNPLLNWHQNVLSREEYYHAYPKAGADWWIEWSGEPKSPVENGVLVDVKLKGGGYHEAELLDDASWSDAWGDESIIAYRLHKPEVKPEFCESVTRSIPEPEAKPTIEQLAADYRNAKGYADRKQDEADKASMESDAALSQLEDAIAAIGFVITPLAATVKEPELVAAVKVGDQVGCVESNIKRDKYSGMVGRLHFIDESDTSTPYLVDFGVGEKIWCKVVKFIRRP